MDIEYDSTAIPIDNQFTDMEKLSIVNTDITALLHESDLNLTKLTALNLEGSIKGYPAIELLVGVLRSCVNLKKLNMSCGGIELEGSKLLAG